MAEVSHQPCPFCGSSDAFSYNTDKGVGYCHSCGQSKRLSEPNNYKESKSMEVVQEYTEHRGIKPSTLKYYDCRDVYS